MMRMVVAPDPELEPEGSGVVVCLQKKCDWTAPQTELGLARPEPRFDDHQVPRGGCVSGGQSTEI